MVFWLGCASKEVPAPDSTPPEDTAPSEDTSPPGDTSPPEDTEPFEVSGFATPESVLYDPVSDVYLVSNIDGGPTGADDNGFISRVAPDGTVLDPRWIDGTDADIELDAPKGMAITEDRLLFVADIDDVRIFDLSSGEPVHHGDVHLATATFLNDVTPYYGGVVFVSDSAARAGDTAIWAVASTGLVGLVEGDDVPTPNGLLSAGGTRFYVHVASEDTLITLDDAEVSRETLPAGQLDGIVQDAAGVLYASSWEAGAVFRQGDDGWEIAVEGLDSPADIGYDTSRDRLLVPLFNDDAIRIVPL